MNPGPWQLAEDLFHQALERPKEDRIAFLNRIAANGDGEVVEQVLRLLAEHDAEPGFMEEPLLKAGIASDALKEIAADNSRHHDTDAGRTLPTSLHISGYRLIELVGEGGMGLVYSAEQESPQRKVALKIIKPGFITPDTLRRFGHESEILGRLCHPCIGRIFEAGAVDTGGTPLPFFAMEFIDGVSITRFARENRLDHRKRLGLFVQLCDAVHYAHQQGVIHRDLKPANILVERAGTEGAPPRPIILDFGVARVIDAPAQSVMTDRTRLIGTLPYMSPEQIAAEPGGIDTRSDVYALGVILYELLTGTRPHELQGTSLAEAIRIVTEEDPKPLGTMDRRLRGDPETILGKAMAKDREQRYQAASALAADIRRLLNHEAIAARPPSVTYQLRVFARRNRTLVGGMAGILLALVVGLAATLWQKHKADENAAWANQRAEQVTAINDFLQELLTLVNNPAVTHDISFADLLDRAAKDVNAAFSDHPLAEASVRETLGDAYYRLGRPAAAEEQYRRGLDIRRAELGKDDPATLGMMSGLAMCWMSTSRLDDAEAMCRQVLNGRRRVLGEYHRKTLAVLANLAAISDMRGDKDEAEARYRQLLKLLQEHLGTDDRDTLACMQNLASILRSGDRFEEAEPLYRDSVELFVSHYGENNPDTLKAMDNLAVFLKHAGHLEEAEVYYVRGLNGCRRLLGDAHPSTLTAMHNYGTFLFSTDSYEESISLFEEAVELAHHALGDRNPLTQAIRKRFALILKRRERYDEAEIQYLSLYRAVLDELGPSHDRTQKAIRDLARLYEEWQRPAEAAAYKAMLSDHRTGDA
ncbi:MAG: serine/threonine protein kinase [Phycisphaerales bacterium]|nr:MAG: serine/threonine protein kinase [Phycisphaerales bacterium]